MSVILELEATLEANNASWRVNDHLLSITEPLKFRLGGLSEKFVPAVQIKPLDFKTLLSTRTSNPFVLQRRVAHEILAAAAIRPEFLIGSIRGVAPLEGGAPAGGPTPSSIDWRNRWGWPWITTIRDQNGCEACWLFAAVALVEAMVRIEHCVWPCI